MTMIQAQTVWALCREGLQQCADEAETKWLRGEPFHLDDHVQASTSVKDLVRRSNLGLDFNIEAAQPA